MGIISVTHKDIHTFTHESLVIRGHIRVQSQSFILHISHSVPHLHKQDTEYVEPG